MKINESIYQYLFESIKEGLLISNSSGLILENNRRLEELLAYDKNELKGQKIEVLIPQAARGRHAQNRENYHENPTNRSMGQGMNLKALRKDNKEIFVEVSLSHLEIDGDKLVIALVSDISKRVEIEEEIKQLNKTLEDTVAKRTKELQESQYLYQLISRNFPDGTINVFDKNLNYVFAEGQELYSMGITSEKLIGTNYLKRLPEDLKETIESNLKKAFEGESVSFYISLNKSHYQLTAVPLDVIKERPEQILVVERNVTKQYELNQKMVESLENEKMLNELKSRFVSMASHEFRTPLTTIYSSSQLMQKYVDRGVVEKLTKHIKRIQNAVNNLNGILNDFLSLDKLETNEIQFNPVQTDVKAFFGEILGDLEVLLKPDQKLIDFYDLDQSTFSFDTSLLRNVMTNLVSNAIKYSDSGTEIIISIISKNGRLRIEVKDEGIGIPKEEQVNLFQRFYRAKNVFNVQGTGLGLNIVKRYLDIIGGEISFESEEGLGSKFVVELKNG